MDGVDAHEWSSGVRLDATKADHQPQRPLAARLDGAAGRFAKDGDVSLKELRLRSGDLEEPAL